MAYNKLIDLNLLSNFLSKIKSLIPTKTSDLENDSEYITGMEILSYGNSTWNDFLTAYTAKKVVYCRASSNSNPASGSQTRLAFMAYVNNADNPTNVEFQYYRSVSSHTNTQQGDQVFVYKLDKTSGWSVITREASSKVVAGTNMTSSYSNDTVTLNASIPSNVSDLTNDSGYITGITSFDVTTALGYTPSNVNLLNNYRTTTEQNEIDDAQDERLDAVEQTTTATTIGPVAIASFDASVAGMPLKGLTVNIEPVQAGSGDPSPDNVRPITGWTGAKVFYPGLDITRGLSVVLNKYISTSGVETDSSTDLSHTDYFPVTPGTTLYFSSYWDELPGSAPSIAFYDASKTFKSPRKYFYSGSPYKGKIGYNFAALTVPSGCYYAILNFNYGLRDRMVLTDKDPTISYPTEAGTVYGGTVDAVNRKLNAYPYYASYNGETLTGPWVSSMDVYTPGATPTLGAQVVDMGGAATSYDLSDVPEITTLLGENNIWADCGDVTVTYGAYLETIKSYANQLNNNIPNAGSISNTGLISIKHDSTELFTIQLPLYNGGVSNGT